MGAAGSTRGSGEDASPEDPESVEPEAAPEGESVDPVTAEAGADAAKEPRKQSRLDRRREKIRAEIERNRRGEYKVPTWVLALALVAFVAGWVALIVFV